MNGEIPEIIITGEIRKSIYLVVNEALHNALKYSQADKVTLTIVAENNKLHISIQDNGIGFNLNEREGKGNGLSNMKKRVEECRENFSIDPSSANGTQINITYKIS